MIIKFVVKFFEYYIVFFVVVEKYGVYVYVEYYKCYDFVYVDVKFRVKKFGDFNYFYSYMFQFKF